MQALPWSGVPRITPAICKRLCRTRNVIAPCRMAKNFARKGGWAFTSGAVEVRQRFHCAASLAQSGFFSLSQMSRPTIIYSGGPQGSGPPLRPYVVTYNPPPGGPLPPGRTAITESAQTKAILCCCPGAGAPLNNPSVLKSSSISGQCIPYPPPLTCQLAS